MIKVFLVEDHELFASGVRTELGKEFELVGHAGTVEDAVKGVLEPDFSTDHVPFEGVNTVTSALPSPS